MSEVTQLLQNIHEGNSSSSEKLLPLLYHELRKLATQKIAQEKPGQTLQATALVHEAYLRLVQVEKSQDWVSRGHFFGAAAEAMRRILIEQARRKSGPQAGGDRQRLEISLVDPESKQPDVNLLSLNSALERLEAKDSRKAELVKLRFFAGLTNEQAAEMLDVSARTAYEDWGYAKAWLKVEMTK